MKSRFILSVLAILVLGVTTIAQETTPSLKAEIQVCTSIVDRTPQGTDTTFGASVEKLYCWSRITGAASGEATVTHIWLHEGKELRQVNLPVKSSSWRTWSEKSIYGMSGNWEVRVVDAQGNSLASAKFTVGK